MTSTRDKQTNSNFETACPRCGERMAVLTKTVWHNRGTARVPDNRWADVYELVTEASSGMHVCVAVELRKMLIIAKSFTDSDTFIEANGDFLGWEIEIVLGSANPDTVRGHQYHTAVVLGGVNTTSPLVSVATECVRFGSDHPAMLFLEPTDVISEDVDG